MKLTAAEMALKDRVAASNQPLLAHSCLHQRWDATSAPGVPHGTDVWV